MSPLSSVIARRPPSGERWTYGPDDADEVLAETVELAGRDVLDVGCGIGELACDIARRTGAQVLGVDLSAGEVLWRYEHPKRKFPYLSSAASDGKLVVVGGRDKMVHSLDTATGEVQWTRDLIAAGVCDAWIVAAPIVPPTSCGLFGTFKFTEANPVG